MLKKEIIKNSVYLRIETHRRGVFSLERTHLHMQKQIFRDRDPNKKGSEHEVKILQKIMI